MELSGDWHKRTNVKLVDILSDIMKELRPPKVPTHGYTIAEKAPEVVTAPGVYFPAEKGRVIPLESRESGGAVTPTRTLQQMLEKLASYGPFPIPGAATQSTAARQRVEGQGENRFETAIGPESKRPPLVARQDGGEVDPNLFKETFLVGGDTQQGIEAAANTGSLKDTPINVSPLTPSLQSFAPEANPTPTNPSTPLTGIAEYEASGRRMRGLPELALGATAPTGIAEYEESGRRMRGLPTSTTSSPTLAGSSLSNVAPLQSYAPSKAKAEGSLTNPLTPSPPVNPTNKRLNQITGFLRSFMKPPPKFRENRRSPIFESDQRAAYDKKWKPYTDFMEGTKETPLFSRAPGGATSPDPFEGLSEEERKKLYEGLKTEFPIESLAPSHEPVNQIASVITPDAQKVEQTVVPREEPTKQIKGGVSENLSAFKPEILPSGETRYTLPGTEGTARVGLERFFVGGKEVPKGTPGAVSGDEAARQRIFNEVSLKSPEIEAMNRWQTPGYKEAQLAEAQKRGGMISIKGGPPMPSVIDVSPGYEKTWEEAHPENVKAGTPHLVQNASGGYDLIYPSGTPGGKAAVSPTGVIGKTQAEKSPGRKSEVTFDSLTGKKYQQDFEWKGGGWQPVGEKRVVGGPAPQAKEGLKINKLKEIRSLLAEDYANQIGTDVKDLQKKLSPIQKKAYNRILAFSEKHAETMEPRAALDQALKDWYSTFGQKIEQYEIGKVYPDAQGRKAKYLGEGKWELTK